MFCFAKLSSYDFGIVRFLGSGLGNLLFPWARSIVAARKYGLKPIWPTWQQIKIGTFLRQERDKRLYNNLFIPHNDYIYGIKKGLLLTTAPYVSERHFLENTVALSGRKVVIFKGMNNYFQDIYKDHALIKNELLRIVREEHKTGLIQNWQNSISVHIRIGDFSIPNKSLDVKFDKFDKINYRLPISWYVSVVKTLRHQIGEQYKVYIFSDGHNSELSEILSLPNTTRVDFGSSVADLLALSQANILVASGSTFSMWASFLGRMPVIWYPGQLRQQLYYDSPDIEIEWAPTSKSLKPLTDYILRCS